MQRARPLSLRLISQRVLQDPARLVEVALEPTHVLERGGDLDGLVEVDDLAGYRDDGRGRQRLELAAHSTRRRMSSGCPCSLQLATLMCTHARLKSWRVRLKASSSS